MKRLWLVIALVTYGVSASSAWAASPDRVQTQARHKSGPVTVRGIAKHVGSKGFTLQTTTHGAYVVDDTPPTQVVEKGRTGHVTVTEGSHVGVRGYVKSKTIRAIEVRVYPVAAKQVSIRGTIASIAGPEIHVRTGAGSTVIVVNAGTVIQTSQGVLKLSDLRVNDRLEARVVPAGHDTVAVHIHVYRTKAPLHHVQVKGEIVATDSRRVVVKQSGSSVSIALTSQTRYYSGASRTPGSLREGEQITVYACCAGHALVAESIHIRPSRPVIRTTELRGTVVALSSGSLRLDIPHGPTIRLLASTIFELGAQRSSANRVRVGDLVSVRGSLSGSVLTATRVHVFVASRKVSTVQGSVTGISASSLQVTARGITYSLAVSNRTAIRLSGRPVPVSQIRRGDRVRAVGLLGGHRLQATSIDLSRPTPKVVTVRGTLTAVGAGWLQVTHSSGAKDIVRLDAHTRVVFQGHQIASGSLFPGMKVTMRGTRSGSELHASSVAAGAKLSSETGRLVTVAGSTFQLKRSSGAAMRVDLPTGVVPHDGARSVALRQIGRGAYLHVSGYLLLTKALRATSVTVLHPNLEVRGVLSWHGQSASVVTANGEIFASSFGKSTTVVVNHLNVAVRPQDIPGGTTVHVSGIVGISGSLAVQIMTVQLQSMTVRAKVTSLQSGDLVVTSGSGLIHVRLNPGTTISQGSHPLVPGDVVVGDDVTVYGYVLKGNVVTARKLAVHRRLVGLDGIVDTISDKGFSLTASDGSHTVLVSSTTLIFGVAGATLVSGMKVHVSGYLRGDAVILATRVRILKTP